MDSIYEFVKNARDEYYSRTIEVVPGYARVHRHFHIEDDTATVPALTYLRRLCEYLSGILGFAVEVDGENGFLPTTSIQPVGLIVNELGRVLINPVLSAAR
jgi:two-component sensor histidine kinase